MPRPDPLQPGTKAWNDRQLRHRHNSFTGHVAMLRANMRAIMAAETTTHLAKTYAKQILAQSEALAAALKERA